jgi:methionyl-tRNA formyltransferase
MKFAYLGYRNWSEKILNNLTKEGWDIDKFTPSNNEYKFPGKIINPKKIQDLDFSDYKSLFFYGWSWIVPEKIIDENECVCLHPSPLPKYRGGSPLQHQIINGEDYGAVSLFKMDSGLDTGPIYYQEKISLEGNLENIFGEIIKVGTRITNDLLIDFKNNDVNTYVQDESQATTYIRRKPDESELTYEKMKNMNSRQLNDFIRALQDPYPIPFITCNDGKKVYLKKSDL